MRSSVESVLCRDEHGTGGKHDGGIVENPVVVEGDEVMNGLSHEGVALLGEHEIV